MPESLQPLTASLTTKAVSWYHSTVDLLPNVALAILAVVAFSVGSRWVRRGVDNGLSRTSMNTSVVQLIATIAKLSTIALGVFIALSLLHLDKAVTSLLAGVGVVGLALGFAFQDIAANFMSGVFMAVRRPFQVGDQIELDGRVANVQAIQLRSTHVHTTDGLSIIVPNKQVFQNSIVNYTDTDQRRLDLPVGVAYNTDLEQARDLVREAVDDMPSRSDDREVEVFFTEFGGSSINLVARIWLSTATQGSYMAAQSDAIIRIKKVFDDHDITIPFPIRTLDFGARDVGGERLDVALTAANDTVQGAAE